MERGQKLYIFGMAWAVFIVLLGELVWLPDPIRFGHGKALFWIDTIDVAAFAILLVPLAWMAAAILGLAGSRRGGGGNRRAAAAPQHPRSRLEAGAAALTKAAVLAASAGVIGALLMEPRRLVGAACLLGAAWLFAALDLALTERARRARAIPRRSLAVLAASILMLLALGFPTSYMVTYPGITINMNRYASAEGGTVHEPMIGVLVFQRPAFPADWVFAKLFPHYEFEPRENLGMSLGAYDSLVRDMKAEADTLGSAVAFRQVGLGKGAVPHGVKVSAVLAGGPAEGKLRPGDVIGEVNGRGVVTSQDITTFMKGVRPGDEVTLSVKRDGKPMTLRVGTKAHPDNANQAAFGIQIQDELEYDLPRKVQFHAYLAHEGGPSHGAMLALTLIDQLTPGGITNGNKIAGTGTINPDGSIGQIGGIEQKAYTIDRSGADVFFVPDGQEKDARRGSDRLTIVPVKTIQEVIDWLKAHPKHPS
jgi:Lon-like protease